MRALIKHWRENLIKIAIFIDGGLGTDSDLEKTKQDSLFDRNSLNSSGFIVNDEKSIWESKQNLTCIGVSVDLTKMELYIPEKRIN